MKEGTGCDPFSDSASDDGDDATEADPESESPSQDETETTEGVGESWAVTQNSVKTEREMVPFYLWEFIQDRESGFHG